ncbi:MAG TPA: glycosyltransferase family 39 protein [Gaiellaceae bacterium]
MTETLEQPRGRSLRLPAALPASARLRDAQALAAIGVAAALAGGIALGIRIAMDVRGKPLFEDEAVAGLISARPFGELMHTVWWERGGPPLHFVLAHIALWLDPSAFALRWLSVVFALAAVPLAWDLGRRLGGHVAAGATAVAVAASSLLVVYGSFARMYALYVFAATLAVDLFVRAVRLRTGRAAFAAALAAWLLPAVHPYGIFLVAAEALVGLALWRGRPLRPALPVAAVALALTPFVIADLRLASRFSVGLDGETRVANPGDAWSQVWRAFQASAGGHGWTLILALVLAGTGLAVLAARREFVLPALLVISASLPPLLLLLARTSSAPGLSPRHLAYVVPLVAGLIGVGTAWAVSRLGPPGAAVALAALTAALLISPVGGIRDPRDWLNDVLGGGPGSVALGSQLNLGSPKDWLEREVGPGSVIFPYSAVYLSALPATRHASALPYAQRATVLRAFDRVDMPVPNLFVSVPVGPSPLEWRRFRGLLGKEFTPVRFGPWLLIEGHGPYRDERDVLLAMYTALAAARDTTLEPRRDELGWYYKTTLSVLCGSLRTFGEHCPPPSLTWLQPAGPPSKLPRLGD